MLDRDASLNECCALNTSSTRIKDGCPRMAPSPENDTTPKAPDKPRHDRTVAPKEKNKDDKTLSDLNDGELKGLLDEALNYKNPKDREGKSKLFNNLLNAAEEVERNDRAYRAGGSELVRYYNSSAKRGSRHRKKPSSISENMMHGGSLDNLAKEELYETSKHRTKKSVSARQREGGSLPCNVNASTITTSHEYQFLEEARKKKEMTEKKSNNDVEAQSLLEHDSLAQTYQEQIEISSHYQPLQCKYTTKASFQVSGTGEVDGAIQIPYLEQANERKTCTNSSTKSNTQNNVVGTTDCASSLRNTNDGKKVDENGNALHQNLVKTKKKKVLTDKNVVVCNAENVKGHRSDIINDMDKLMEFIGITDDQSDTRNGRSIKSKQLNRHSSDDTSKSSKKRTHSSKSKQDNRSKLKKSNSLGEISTTNLDDFEFNTKTGDKVVMRNNKNSADKPRERRSWGNMEPPTFHQNILYSNASAENLETAEFRVVTKKKKSKKRRNSISGRSTKTSTTSTGKNTARGPSPDPRRKSACSVPHSEKSNDSSDVDSVHSLPIDTQRLDLSAATRCLNMPISYADMAKTQERQPKEKSTKPASKEVNEYGGTPIRCGSVGVVPPSPVLSCGGNNNNNNNNVVPVPNPTGVVVVCEHKINAAAAAAAAAVVAPVTNVVVETLGVTSAISGGGVVNKNTPPDVHNIKNFPAITKQVAAAAVQVNVVVLDNNVNKTMNMNMNKNSNKINNRNNHQTTNKNVKNNNVNNNNKMTTGMAVCTVMENHQNSVQQNNDCGVVMTTTAGVHEDGEDYHYYSSSLPPDIPDVQTIEKMQMIGQGHHLPPPPPPLTLLPPTVAAAAAASPLSSNCYEKTSNKNNNNNNNSPSPLKNGNDCINNTSLVDCDMSRERTTSVGGGGGGSEVMMVRPPVVILSGFANSKEVPGLVFGFDINEQLLSEDGGGEDFCCEDFISRYVAPDVYTATSHNHDKIVNYIGAAWEEAVVNLSNGKVQYYSDLL